MSKTDWLLTFSDSPGQLSLAGNGIEGKWLTGDKCRGKFIEKKSSRAYGKMCANYKGI